VSVTTLLITLSDLERRGREETNFPAYLRMYARTVWPKFLPRDAMRKRGLRCRLVSVCPSVYPSVTLVHCIQTVEDIVKLFSQPGSPNILVYRPPGADTNSKGNHFSYGAQNTRGGKNLRFSPFMSETVAHGCYGTLVGNHRWRIDRCQFGWPWVTHSPGFKVTVYSHGIFEVELIRCVLLRTKLP